MVNRVELVKKLELVGRALATNDLVPIMKCFCFDGQCVYADNGEQTIIAPCETEAMFVVNGQTLLGLLRASSSEEVNFSIEGYEVIGRVGRRTFKLPYETPDKFLFEKPAVEWDLVLNTNGLAACLLTTSKDLTKEGLMGILVNGSLYSSDGDAITRYNPNFRWNQLKPYMMPNAFCETVLKLAQGENDEIRLAPSWALAKLGDYQIYSRLMDPPKDQATGEMLDFEDIINKTIKDHSVYAPIPAGLDEALSSARVVADPEGKPTQLKVEATKGGSKLRLLTDTPIGVVNDVLPFNQHEVTALVSAQLMQRSIGLTTQMSILENCCTFIDDEAKLYILLSNYG